MLHYLERKNPSLHVFIETIHLSEHRQVHLAERYSWYLVILSLFFERDSITGQYNQVPLFCELYSFRFIMPPLGLLEFPCLHYKGKA